MAEETAKKQPIIIKRVKKAAHAHHGGAWKIAYADFVTAMMAFFLLLWLLNSVTQEQLEGISNYFAPVSASSATSGAGGVLGGQTISEPGASQSATSRDSVTVELPPPKAGTGGKESSENSEGKSPEEVASEDALKKKEEEQFEDAKAQLEATMEGIPQLKNLKDSLMIDNTPEGLRIQLVDKDGLSMFPGGGSELYLHTKKLLEVVAEIIRKLPQNVSISGHTDATRFAGRESYSNWELSADRANAARRWLQQIKIPESRIDRVVGKAATEPLVLDDPTSPTNRRLSIILLRGTGEKNPTTKIDDSKEALPGLNAIKRDQLKPAPPPAGAPQPAPGQTPGKAPAMPDLRLDIAPGKLN